MQREEVCPVPAAGEDDDGAKGHVGKRARGGAARAQRTADKNRQAQKRYRERQSARCPRAPAPAPCASCQLQIRLHGCENE